jgi:zinc D-Ala-D-Ala carboxypeptidase
MVQLSAHFDSSEFTCRCCGKWLVHPELVARLERAREIYGAGMKVLSGYRCPKHNTAVGGVDNSYHCQGKAADIEVSDGHHRFEMLNAFLAAGFRRIGIYAQFIHVDVGEAPSDVIWVG